MPKVPVQKLNRDKLYNVDEVDMQMNFGERLRKYFKPHDTVKVQNVDSEVIKWQFLEEDKENFTIEDDSNIKIVTRDDPDLWRIEPGDVDILEGCCAYLMIEALFKQMTARKSGRSNTRLTNGISGTSPLTIRPPKIILLKEYFWVRLRPR